MSRAFEGLTIPACIVFFLLLIGGCIRTGVKSLTGFLEDNYIILIIIFAAISLIISAIVFYLKHKLDNKEILSNILYSLSTCLVIAQNFAFLLYGLYVALTTYPDSPGLLILGVVGFILFYVVDAFFTIGAILISFDHSYSFWIPTLVFIGGAVLIYLW